MTTSAASRPLAAAGAGLLALLLMSGCLGGTATGTGSRGLGSFQGAKEWAPDLEQTLGDPDTSGMKSWATLIDAPPKAYDFDGDGHDELVAMGQDTYVQVFDVDSGQVLARLKTTYPQAWHIERVLNAVEAGVLEPGQPPSIVVADAAAYVAVWRYVPAKSNHDDGFAFEKVWEHRMDECRRSPGMDAKPVLADLDGDGALEILVQTEEEGFYALRADGSTMWRQCWAGGNGPATVGDLDADGRPEAVFASDSGFISVIDGRSGKPDWTFDLKSLGITPGSISVAPTIAELDGQPPQEILVTARNAPSEDPATWPDAHMAIVAVHQNSAYQAELLWMKQPTWANPLSYTQLVVHDVDGDGMADIFGLDWNTIGHRPGDWEVLGPAHLFRLDHNGDDVWMRTMESWWSNKDIALAKFDGGYSVLVNAPSGQFDGVWRIDADDGKAQAFLPLEEWKMTRGPLLYDLDHDGRTHLVFPVEPMNGPEGRGAILVYDLEMDYDVAWRGAP